MSNFTTMILSHWRKFTNNLKSQKYVPDSSLCLFLQHILSALNIFVFSSPRKVDEDSWSCLTVRSYLQTVPHITHTGAVHSLKPDAADTRYVLGESCAVCPELVWTNKHQKIALNLWLSRWVKAGCRKFSAFVRHPHQPWNFSPLNFTFWFPALRLELLLTCTYWQQTPLCYCVHVEMYVCVHMQHLSLQMIVWVCVCVRLPMSLCVRGSVVCIWMAGGVLVLNAECIQNISLLFMWMSLLESNSSQKHICTELKCMLCWNRNPPEFPPKWNLPHSIKPPNVYSETVENVERRSLRLHAELLFYFF